MIPAGTRPWTRAQIAAAFGVEDLTTILDWAAQPDFPRPAGTAGKFEIYDAPPVIGWVSENRPLRAPEPQPRIAADDRLVGRRQLGAELGALTAARRVLADGTVRSYLSTGKIPRPDRTPEDGGTPQVTEPSWLLSTLVEAAAGFRGSGRTKTPPSQWRRPEAIEVPEPVGEDLLDLADFATEIGRATGKTVKATTMTSYRSRGQLPREDRLPDDDLTPRVPIPLWWRRTVEANVAGRRRS